MKGERDMNTQIHGAALALPDAERAELAYKLLQSLKPPAENPVTGNLEDNVK
jgi:hypothetical protein